MTTTWFLPADERHEVVSILQQKLGAADATKLLREKLGSEYDLVKSIFGDRSLTHLETCSCLVALSGLQVLRDAAVRQIIVANGHDDQVRACFREFLSLDKSIKTVDDFTDHEMRIKVSRRAWHSGSQWSRAFCDAFDLPAFLAGRELDSRITAFESVDPYIELNPLHDFQNELKASIEEVITRANAQRCLVALPTGAGKTRMMVDTALGLSEVSDGRRLIVWVAQHDELCEQAVQCFAQAWRSQRRPGNRPLTIQRVWKSLNPTIDLGADIVVGIPESLVPRLRATSTHDRNRIALSVIDEAHHALSTKYEELFSLLGGSPIVGITATPATAQQDGTEKLVRRFGNRLLTSPTLGLHPVQVLQDRKILAQADFETVPTNFRVDSEIVEIDAMQNFGDLPPGVLEKLGRSISRNLLILRRLIEVKETDGPVLCFATSVASARAIAAALVVAGRTAGCIDAETEKWNRADIIRDFRSGRVQFLLNYGVLATGFDAPQVSVLVLSRPTTSPVLFEQMIGRGLRGPANGGTLRCKVIYFEDDFSSLNGVRPLSYERFIT